MKIFVLLMLSFLFSCSSKENSTISTLSIESRLAYIWANKSNQSEVEQQLSLKLTKSQNGNFEYDKAMTKVIAVFAEKNNALRKLVFINYQLNPASLQKEIPCTWIEKSKIKFIGNQKVELKEYICAEKNVLIKNNENSYSLWETWFGF